VLLLPRRGHTTSSLTVIAAAIGYKGNVRESLEWGVHQVHYIVLYSVSSISLGTRYFTNKERSEKDKH